MAAGREIRLFLDANVLFSCAYDPESRAAVLFQLAVSRRAVLITSQYAIEEARRNLELKRPTALNCLRQIESVLQRAPEASQGLVRDVVTEHKIPPGDGPILATAIRCSADYLVTGDKAHFGRLLGKALPQQRLKVISLRAAIELLLAA